MLTGMEALFPRLLQSDQALKARLRRGAADLCGMPVSYRPQIKKQTDLK